MLENMLYPYQRWDEGENCVKALFKEIKDIS